MISTKLLFLSIENEPAWIDDLSGAPEIETPQPMCGNKSMVLICIYKTTLDDT